MTGHHSGEKIVLASNNAGKVREINQLLAGERITVAPQKEYNIPDAIEDGLSFVENAIKKARHASGLSGLPTIADDSGIEVDELNGAPGIYSARFAGPEASDRANMEKLLEHLREVPEERRSAHFQCLMVYMRHAEDPTPIICQGTWDGSILFKPRGENGFGYDPVFYVPAHDCSSAELPPEIKNRLSHRGQALRKLLQALSQ
ncbi:MAG: RdgB/HAM1 family non-canonical purine NTP pyrophosphatase [Candidatus Thiodiazotropha sp. (ex Epidulcina cf. delphinae)]|nr:RdgB/HAM1 family non-canonical purine NTP pyrophosphatase [Candidatus Thiodiazotropha sp. (ex Epidulcina cf. delphinae)]